MFWAQRNCALMLLNDFPLTWPFFLSFFLLFTFFLFCFFFCATFSPIPSSIISLVTRWRLWVCILGGGSRLQCQWIRRRAPSGLTNEFRVRASPCHTALPPHAFCLLLLLQTFISRRDWKRFQHIEQVYLGAKGTGSGEGGREKGGLSSWRQNRKTLRKRVNNDFSFLLQQPRPPHPPRTTSPFGLYPPLLPLADEL